MNTESIAFATCNQVAKALVAPATVHHMDERALQTWRMKRLEAMVEREGGKAAAGRKLGYRDGAFVGQMLRGERPITEKTVMAAHALSGYGGWFDPADTVVPIPVMGASAAPVPGEAVIHVPLLANAGSMGTGNEALHDDVIVGSIALSPTWIAKRIHPTSVKALRFIHAYGDSMSPTFEDGDILLVDTGAISPSGADGVYVLEASHRVFIKRITERLGGGYEVTSDNPGVKTVDILNGGNQIEVRGRVVWVWNGRKL